MTGAGVAIIVVRHGETAGNAARVLQHPDTPLSTLGAEQARRVARRLAGGRVEAIVSSDYARARATAEAVAQACGVALELDPELRERSFGALRGRAYAELDFDPFAPDYAPPGGETWDELHRRVDRAWERTCARAGGLRGDLVLVTHGLVCHSLASRRLHIEAGLPRPGGFGNTAVTVIEPHAPFAVRLLACVAHLADPQPDPQPEGRQSG